MSEREIRQALEQVLDRLDVKARAQAKQRGRKLVYPLMLGAGLMVASCDDETETLPPDAPAYGVPTGTPTATQTGSGTGTPAGTATGAGGGTATGSGSATGGGAASGGSGGAAAGGGDVGGAMVEYMAPDP